MSIATQTILEILKYILPAIIVLIACYVIIKNFLVNDTERQRLAIFGDNVKTTMPLRLQAYERLAMFLERIDIKLLIARFYNSNLSAVDLQLTIIENIRTEFEYNLSQQIYVSKEVWQTVATAKEQEIAMINTIAKELPAESGARQLVERLTDWNLTREEDTPREIALDVVNNEAKRVLLSA
jgi:hypothetical protein